MRPEKVISADINISSFKELYASSYDFEVHQGQNTKLFKATHPVHQTTSALK